MKLLFHNGPRDGFEQDWLYGQAPSELLLPFDGEDARGRALYRSRLHGGNGKTEYTTGKGRFLHVKLACGRDCIHYDFVGFQKP